MRTGAFGIAFLAGALGLGSPLSAQDALAKANADLQEAGRQLNDLKSQVAREEGQLIKEVVELDLKVLELTKELRELESKEALATTEEQRLDNELEQRGVEFDYLFKTFDQYADNLVNRIHVAETQLYEERLKAIARKTEGAGDDLVARIEASTPALQIGIDRLLGLAGGETFEGKAIGPGNNVKTGKFALFGPIGYFASNDGEVVGMTAFQAGDVAIPALLEMEGGAAAQVRTLVEEGEGIVPVDASLGKAFQMKENKKSLREFLKGGGVVGYAILLFGLVAAGLALFKLIEIMRFRVPSRGEVNGILDKLLAGDEGEAIEDASELPGLAGRVVEAGARHFKAKRRILEDALFEKLSAVQPRLERLLPFLAVIAAAAPMAGLLGTVLGIMKTFDMMAQFGSGDAKYTAGGIGEALITTFLGLTVAIPTIMVHGVLKSYARSRIGQVEGIALAMINGTTELEKSDGEQKERRRSGDDEDEDDYLEDALGEPA